MKNYKIKSRFIHYFSIFYGFFSILLVLILILILLLNKASYETLAIVVFSILIYMGVVQFFMEKVYMVKNRGRFHDFIDDIEMSSFYRNVYNNKHVPFIVINPKNGNIVDVNEASTIFYGYNYEEMTALKIWDINTMTKDKIRKAMEQAENKEKVIYSFKHKLSSGEIKDVDVYTGPIRIKGNNFLYSIVIDATDKKKAEKSLIESQEKLKEIAYRDTVNKLYNYNYFLDKIDLITKEDKAFSLGIVSISNINDIFKRLGFDYINILLEKMYQILKINLPPNAIVALLSKNEFIIGLSDVNEKNIIRDLFEKIFKHLENPVEIDGYMEIIQY